MSSKRNRSLAGVMAGLGLTLLLGHATAATIAWTDWTSVSIPGSSASGTIPGTSTTVAFADRER